MLHFLRRKQVHYSLHQCLVNTKVRNGLTMFKSDASLQDVLFTGCPFGINGHTIPLSSDDKILTLNLWKFSILGADSRYHTIHIKMIRQVILY